MTDDHRAIAVHITGPVQGVGYRDWTRRQASELGITGWVRNEADGSVAALIAGPAESVAQMIERLWHGPRFASVTNVRADVAETTEILECFRIVR